MHQLHSQMQCIVQKCTTQYKGSLHVYQEMLSTAQVASGQVYVPPEHLCSLEDTGPFTQGQQVLLTAYLHIGALNDVIYDCLTTTILTNTNANSGPIAYTFLSTILFSNSGQIMSYDAII